MRVACYDLNGDPAMCLGRKLIGELSFFFLSLDFVQLG